VVCFQIRSKKRGRERGKERRRERECVCVCVWEREREGERKGGRERGRERESLNVVETWKENNDQKWSFPTTLRISSMRLGEHHGVEMRSCKTISLSIFP
jgi:hypothetical protein